MKKTISVIMAALSFALVAGATQPPPPEFPRMEAFLGYQFTRFNPNSGFVPSLTRMAEAASSFTTSTNGPASRSMQAP